MSLRCSRPPVLEAARTSSTASDASWMDPAVAPTAAARDPPSDTSEPPSRTHAAVQTLAPTSDTQRTLSALVGDTGTNRTVHTAGGLQPDTVHVFRVVALSESGPSKRSDPLRVATLPANSPPTASAGADRAVTEGQTFTLTGTATDPDGDHLTYQWSHDSALAVAFGNATAISTTVTAPQVDSDTTITFTLSVSDGTNDPVTDRVTVTVTDTVEPPPATPADTRGISGLALASVQPGTIRATWDAPGETPRDYRVSWAKAGEAFLTWTNLSGNAFPAAPSYTITGLEEGEEYKVKVRARYDGGGPGDWSGVFTVTVAGTG